MPYNQRIIFILTLFSYIYLFVSFFLFTFVYCLCICAYNHIICLYVNKSLYYQISLNIIIIYVLLLHISLQLVNNI